MAESKPFFQSKFDNISLMLLIVFLVCLLVWVDKHGNGDFEKWLEVFTAGIGGAYLGLITASRQAWTNGKNGNGAQPPPPAPVPPIAIVPPKDTQGS
jgi:hypothetical protein